MGKSPTKKQLQEHKEDDEIKELFKWAKHKKVPPENIDTTPHKIKMENKNQIIIIYNMHQYISIIK
jgi:hypothetical protein